MARTMTFFGCVPVMMNPPIRTLSPVSTRKRVEMFPKVPGEAVGVGAAVGVGVGVRGRVGGGLASRLGWAFRSGWKLASASRLAWALRSGWELVSMSRLAFRSGWELALALLRSGWGRSRRRGRGWNLIDDRQQRGIIGVFAGVKSLRLSRGFSAANDPPKVTRRVGNPRLHVREQSAPAPRVGCVHRADCRGRANRGGKIATVSDPKTGVVERVKPGCIVWLRLNASAAWLARIGSALTPIARCFAQRDRRGAPMRHRQEHRKGRPRDRRIGGNRGEIERDQSTAQAGGVRLSREEIHAMTVAEQAFAVLIKRVVLLRRQKNRVSKSSAAQRSQNQKSRQRFACHHWPAAKDPGSITSEAGLQISNCPLSSTIEIPAALVATEFRPMSPCCI